MTTLNNFVALLWAVCRQKNSTKCHAKIGLDISGAFCQIFINIIHVFVALSGHQTNKFQCIWNLNRTHLITAFRTYMQCSKTFLIRVKFRKRAKSHLLSTLDLVCCCCWVSTSCLNPVTSSWRMFRAPTTWLWLTVSWCSRWSCFIWT